MKLTILAMRFKTKTLKICLVVLCLLCSSCTLGSPQFNGATFYMKEIKLTRGKVAIVDDEDFEWLNQHKWFAHKRGSGFYPTRKKNNKQVSMHRAILGVTDILVLVDHRNRNPLDCRRGNLRKCTRAQNNANSQSRKGSVSVFKGVSPYRKNGVGRLKWRATISHNRRITHIGYFEIERDAAAAYNAKAIELHGEFANLNQV